MTAELELGTLVVVVLKARDLNDNHFYKQDVYAQVLLNGLTQRTPVDVKGGQHPVWDAELRFPIMKDSGEKYRNLQVSCWAKEHRTDENLGKGKVDISETLRTGEFDDWVPLETNAVRRGDVYLEMTFYAHGPAKKSSLAAPTNAGLTRRPSKLHPSERLWRPAPITPPRTSPSSSPSHSPAPPGLARRDYSPSQGGNYLAPPSTSPPSSRTSSSSSSPQRRESPLPKIPNETPVVRPSIPTTLTPGAGVQRQQPQHHTQSQPLPPPELPSILRPGRPTGSRNQSPSPDPPSQPHYTTSTPSRSPNPGYYSVPMPGAYPLPDPWGTDEYSRGLSFPVPQASVSTNYTPYQHDTPPAKAPYAARVPEPDLPDPYLQVRYTTPFPLPESSPPRGRTLINPELESRKQALLRAEEEAARRKRQEEEDLELARRLDQELNLS